MDQQTDKILLACLLIVGIILLALLRKRFGGRRTNTVLILGASGAGKTTLFYQLRDGSTHSGTVPSMQPNRDLVIVRPSKEDGKGKEKALELVDIPGHAKVRGMAGGFYSSTRAVIFMVDAVDFMAQKTLIAEHLFEVLSDPFIQKRRVPLLLLCNKTDEGAKAHTADFIRKRLEKELEALRGTRSTLGEGDSQGLALTKPSEAFTFAGLRSPAVRVACASALKGDMEELLSFLCL